MWLDFTLSGPYKKASAVGLENPFNWVSICAIITSYSKFVTPNHNICLFSPLKKDTVALAISYHQFWFLID